MISIFIKFYRVDKKYELILMICDLCIYLLEKYWFLCFGCYLGDFNIVRVLLKYVNIKCIINGELGLFKILGMVLLVIVCFYGYFSIVKMLLNVGVFVNLKFYYWILIVVVSYRGYLCIVEELIKVGVDVNIGFGYKLFLEFVCVVKYNDVVEKLKVVGVDVMGIFLYKIY